MLVHDIRKKPLYVLRKCKEYIFSSNSCMSNQDAANDKSEIANAVDTKNIAFNIISNMYDEIKNKLL